MIGVMGAPGSGKGEVARVFGELGARVIALDALGHELLRNAEVREEIRAEFGAGVLDSSGEVSREALGRVVFADVARLRRLEAIVHPRMVARVRAEVDEFRKLPRGSGPPALVIEGALLLEMGLEPLCDRVLLVTAPRDVRAERLRQSRGWGPEELARRERAQLDDESRRARAHAVVENASGRRELERRVRGLWEEWTWETGEKRNRSN